MPKKTEHKAQKTADKIIQEVKRDNSTGKHTQKNPKQRSWHGRMEVNRKQPGKIHKDKYIKNYDQEWRNRKTWS